MSKIQWTEETWNPVVGCTPVSPGCLNCYAATLAPRLAAMGQAQYAELTVRKTDGDGHARAVFNGTVRCVGEALDKPLRRKKPTMYFVCSMGDLFHEGVPFGFIDRVFAVMALCPQHTFQVLTKRPERMAEYLNQPASLAFRRVCAAMSDMGHRPTTGTWPLAHVWLGTSAEDQARLEERVPHLLRCPAVVRFLSCEPLLGDIARHLGVLFDGGPIHLRGLDPIDTRGKIDWVIVGGESGAHARPCRVEWVRSVVAQCKAAGVPVFVKQLGAKPVVCDVHCNTVPEWVSDWLDTGVAYENVGPPSDPEHRIKLCDRKGGDMTEWPADLRVREMPVEPWVGGVGR
jgi:protein gp37